MGTGENAKVNMKFYFFLLLAILPIFVKAQANRFDRAAETPIMNTYVPIPDEMFMLIRTMASDPEVRERLRQQKLAEKKQNRLKKQKIDEDRRRIIEKMTIIEKRDFENYIRSGIGCLKKNETSQFLNYARKALRLDPHNSTLYYNIGVAYVVLGKKRIGKRWLKIASKKYGHRQAKEALRAMKGKHGLSYNWFLY